jgi:hypothetical protein
MCTKDFECGNPKLICWLGRCKGEECRTHSDCPVGMKCTKKHRCAQTCLTDRECITVINVFKESYEKQKTNNVIN